MRAAAQSFKVKPSYVIVTKEDLECYVRAQQQVADWMQYKHYRAFLLSDYYRSCVRFLFLFAFC